MKNNKASKKKSVTKKASLSTKKASKPLKKQGVQKVSKGNADTTKKRPAKRRALIAKEKRVQTQYDIVRGIVADYCKRNYGRRCTRAESKEIYQSLKLRFLDKDSGTQITLDDIKKDIDKVLAFKGEKTPPSSVILPMPYYEIVTRLYNNDGGFFRPDDTLIIDLKVIDEGKVKTPYAELPYTYKVDIYERIAEYISDVEASGYHVSPPPEFIYDADSSDEDKRIFVWKINFDGVTDKEQTFTSSELKEQKEDKERSEAKIEEKVEEVKESKADADLLALEQEKTKQMEAELAISKEKTKQEAMALLNAGKIDLETFLKLIG